MEKELLNKMNRKSDDVSQLLSWILEDLECLLKKIILVTQFSSD